jgi:hypothetical protein
MASARILDNYYEYSSIGAAGQFASNKSAFPCEAAAILARR